MIEKNSRICIVGAGAAGISAGYYLNKNHYKNFTIIEKESYIGGKCLSDKFDGHAGIFEMGGIELTKNQPYLFNVIDELNKDLPSAEQIHTVEMPPGYLISPYDGKVYPSTHLMHGLGLTEIIKFFEQAFSYIKYVKSNAKTINAPGFLNIGSDWTIPFSSWLDKHNMSLLKRVFYVPICCYGYGHLDDIPTAYALKYMNLQNFMTFLFQKQSIPIIGELISDALKTIFKEIEPLERIDMIGYQGLLETMAATFPDNIMLGKNIERVERENGVNVYFSDGTSMEFEKLIVTVPPFIESQYPNSHLSLLDMDLFKEEAELFQNVECFNYCTYAIDIKPFSQHGYGEIVGKDEEICMPQDGWPTMFYQRESYKPGQKKIVVFYCYSKKEKSLDEMEERLKQNILTIHNVEITKEDILDRRQWKYFPHVSGEVLEAGFYEDLNTLQGRHNTYWLGGLMNFELVENTFHYSHHFVNDIFA